MTTLQLIKAAAIKLAEQHDTKFCKALRTKRDTAEVELKVKAFAEFKRRIAELPDSYPTRGYHVASDPWFQASSDSTVFRINTKYLTPKLVKKVRKLVVPDFFNAYGFERELKRLVALKVITRTQLFAIINP
jgi:hypothetical protein